jgi:putative ABC transport system substrate-binding protein
MKRRDFFTLIGGAVIAWRASSDAQSAARPARVGVLAPGSEESHLRDPRFRAFYQAMEERGWVEGKTVVYERRFAAGQFDRLPNLARQLVDLAPAVIATASSPPAFALKEATATIPIVIMDPGDPVATGLVSSFAHPGINITGVSSMAPDLASKRLEILKVAAPGAQRGGMLFNAAIPPTEVALKQMAEAGGRLAVEVRPIPVRAVGMPAGERSAPGFDDALRMIVAEGADSLLVFADPMTHLHQAFIVRFAEEHRLPALYAGREFVDAGGFISYGPNYPAMFQRGAYFVDRILSGANAAALPIEQPTKFELVINLKAAKALGLTLPPDLLATADEVIE